MLRLNIKTPGKPPVTIDADKRRMTIGRSVRNEICLEDPFASRLHAELRIEGDGLWLSDLGSANGAFLNGQRISGTVQIFPGDRIQIGESVIELQQAGEATRLVTASTTDQLPTADVVAKPEVTKEPTDRTQITSGLLSVIESVRSASGGQEELNVLEHRKDLFAVMSKASLELMSPSSLDEVLSRVIDLIFEGVPADRAYLLLREGTGGELKCKVASYRQGQLSEPDQQIRISQSVTKEVVGRGQAVLTSDAQQDERFRGQQSIVLGNVRSVMAVPLSVNRQTIGMIYVDSPMSVNVFTEDDLQLLTTIASVAAVKIENTLLLEQRLENERMKQQLSNARDIQFRLLPVKPPPVLGYDMTGISFPCYEVGGDYFDFIQEANDCMLIALGDVSGKGMDAALMMSSLHATVRAQSATSATTSELVGRINLYLNETTPANKFVTLFCARLNCRTHELHYTNAGHNPPLLIRPKGDVAYLEAGGLPVGITEFVNYEEGVVKLEPGDVLLTYSDGISEALNPQGEEFTVDGLIQVVRKHAQSGASQLRDRVDEALLQFMGSASPIDDMTLVIVKRTE